MYVQPRTLDDACEALAAAPGVILAGGTDVYPALVDRPMPMRIVDISRVGGLSGIAIEADQIRIGGRTTWAAIRDAALPPALAGLQAAARGVGSVQIQNVGTIGGNLCNASPAADGVPPLLALDAVVELSGRQGRRRLPLADFLLGNRRTARRSDEVLSAVLVPREGEGARSSFGKLGARRYLVISVAMVASTVTVDERGRVSSARIAVGSCSAVAQRLPRLEADLRGVLAGPGLRDYVRPEHLVPLAPIDDLRGSATYRHDAALELVRRTLSGCADA